MPRETSLPKYVQLAEYGAPIWVAMEYRYMPALTEFLEQVDAALAGLRC